LGFLLSVAIVFGSSPVESWVVLAWLPVSLFVAAFLKTRTYSVTEKTLTASYLWGLFPRRYDLQQIRRVKTTEQKPTGREGGFYVVLTLSSKYYIAKRIRVEFLDGTHLKIDGRTLVAQDYVRLAQRLKSR
jgi:RNase P/RNase MRP subunit p29